MTNISKRILQFLCLPGAIFAVVFYTGCILMFRHEIVGVKQSNFKNKLCDSIAPVSVSVWLLVVILVVFKCIK